MTNSDKANEICELAEYTHDKVQCDIAYRAALEMAEWKDKQFQEFLEKESFFLKQKAKKVMAYDLKTCGIIQGIAEYLEDIINELFKE